VAEYTNNKLPTAPHNNSINNNKIKLLALKNRINRLGFKRLAVIQKREEKGYAISGRTFSH